MRTPGLDELTDTQDDETTETTIIVADRQLRCVTQEALDALAKANTPPAIFVRGGRLVRVRTDEQQRPMIEPMQEPHLRRRLTQVADYRRAPAGVAVAPPLDLVRDVLALDAWPFPALEAVIETPAVRPDGTVLDTPGYDAATRLVYMPPAGFVLPPVPAVPTVDSVAAARDLILDDLLAEFPWVSDADKANFVALLLTPLLRPAIAGHVPLALLDKPSAGTGATLLAEIIASITTGQPAAMMTAPANDAEWRKCITSVLMTGAAIIIVDNVTRPLASAELAAVLTASTWADRLLGGNEIARLPQRATWLATGNNLRLAGDIARRSYWIRLDARMNRPWQRDGFRRADLRGWVLTARGELLAALLTLVRHWYATGSTRAAAVALGGFEEWARVVGGVLAAAWVPGFLANRDTLYESIDEEAAAWDGFVATWASTYGDTPVTVAALTAEVRREGSALRDALPDALAGALDARNFGQRLGTALASRADRVFGSDLRLERAATDTHHKVGRWRVRGLRGPAGTVQPYFAEESRTHTNGTKQSPHIPAVPADHGREIEL